MELTGKTAAILGGGGGIGRAIAIGLAREGVTVAIGDIVEAAALETAKMIEAEGGVGRAAICDVGDDDSVRSFADFSFSTLGRVDLVFNHAGVSAGGLLEQVPSEDWNWLLNINLTGLGRSVSAFLPRMAEQGGGWIVNTSSGLGLFHDMPFAGPYIATKSAIVAYSRALSVYALNRNIGVSVFCPDVTMTNFMTSGRLTGIPKELLASAMPKDRIQSPQQAAETLLKGLKAEKFLISAVPDTSEKLLAMAKADLVPMSDDFDKDGHPKMVVSKGGLRVPRDAQSEALRLFNTFAEITRSHYGCLCYDVAVSSEDPERLVIFEAWESQAAADAHAAAPGAMDLIKSLFALGASDFSMTQV